MPAAYSYSPEPRHDCPTRTSPCRTRGRTRRPGTSGGPTVTQQPISRALAQDVTLECPVPWGRPVDLVASLRYDPVDPWAVWFTFRSPGGDVSWGLAREVLLRGLTDPAGQGDVTVWPSIDERGRAVVVLEFSSPDGRLVAQAITHEVYRFLTRTLAAVPLGTETMDLDVLVDALLGR